MLEKTQIGERQGKHQSARTNPVGERERTAVYGRFIGLEAGSSIVIANATSNLSEELAESLMPQAGKLADPSHVILLSNLLE
jgi:hypothetical protein